MLKKLFIFAVFSLLLMPVCNGQLSDDFDDGDYTANVSWTASPADWTVNALLQLQSNNVTANSVFYLSTPNTLATATVWEFYVKTGFNPSSANYIDVYLTASSGDLTLPGNSGYFVRIGNTDDEISLYRKDAGGSAVKIIDGTDGVVDNSTNVLKIKVIRNAVNTWTLLSDVSGTGNFYTAEGQAADGIYLTSAFFGILVRQSTAAFFQKHYIDDITIKAYTPDITPPVVSSATAATATTVDVLFDEPLDIATAGATANYTADHGLGSPAAASADALNSALVHLSFTNNFPDNVDLILTVNGVKDISGNSVVNGAASFGYHRSQRYDVVIDEILADPSPVIGLPASEFIELKNVSGYPVNLSGWVLSDGSSSASLPGIILKADSFVIICTASGVSDYAPLGAAHGVGGFPSLDNDGGVLSLFSSDNKLVHAVPYSILWYRNELKKAGGWSLEMADTKNPCSGFENWKASVDPSGGTPGRKNSIDGVNPDQNAPRLVSASAISNIELSLVFNEPLDSLQASSKDNFTISDGIGTPLKASAVSPVFDKVNLQLATPLANEKVYTVTAKAIADCSGNGIGPRNSARTGLAATADSFDVVINEILFNPTAGGVDYVEIFNRSSKIIDLRQLSLASRNSTGVISTIQQVSNESILIFPGDYIVITEDASIVRSKYITGDPETFIQVPAMPSFPDDAGDVIVLNLQGSIVDEVAYSDKWHFKLITNTEGVALERIDYNAPSVQANFHSAATSAGYGTPGYKNSQFRIDALPAGEIAVLPQIFSPDNDGTDDFASLNYKFPSPGYVANITIFDASGRPVRYLQRNALCGIQGSFQWDGLDEKQKKMPQGIYIFFTEIFNTEGKKKQFKNTIVLARRK